MFAAWDLLVPSPVWAEGEREHRRQFPPTAGVHEPSLEIELLCVVCSRRTVGDSRLLPMGNASVYLCCAMHAPTSVGPGDTVGRFEVVAPLSAGGMGEVYRAWDPALERELALKVLGLHSIANEEALERFKREARSASALNHPNIVTIYEIGASDRCHYIAMELVRGRTLRQLAKESPPLPNVATIGAQAALALGVAHSVGIVHRDIKPENIMVRDDGYVKVLDFGIARLSHPDTGEFARQTGLTRPGTIIGTMRYMSPEQAGGGQLTGASDIFSLGVVLYELAAGRHPFDASSDMAVLSAIILREPVPVSRLNPRAGAPFESLLMRMLEKNPAMRPGIDEVHDQLVRTFQTGTSSGGFAAMTPGAKVVGRSTEKKILRQAFTETTAAKPSLVCLSGEPGIGKSTLVQDFLDEMNAREPHGVAEGRCSERLAGAEAYLPILDALEELLRRDVTGSLREILDRVGPSWRKQIYPTGEVQAGAGAAPAASQERMKRELASFLEEVCRIQPLILVIEDIHWADASTVDLLGYVLTRLETARLLTIVTYRPAELQLTQHPFLALKLDLQTRGIARELPLPFLTREDVETLLAIRFPSNRFPPDFAKLIHSRTEGNPLFVSDVTEYLRQTGVIEKSGEIWTVNGSLPDLQRELPESVRSMVQRKIGQLAEPDCQLLIAAAVQGYSFDSAVVAAALKRDPLEVEDRLDELDRVYTFVVRRDEHEFPDGTLSTRYRFVHVLYQNALYASLSVSRRVALSRAVGEALLRFHEGNAGTAAAELAFLFEAGRDPARAAEFFLMAARNAARVFANGEAVMLARRALTLLDRLPPGPARSAQELPLRIILGTSLAATQGYAAPEVHDNMARARALAEEFGEKPQLAPALWGLFAYYLVSGSIQEAYALAQTFLRVANASGDSLMLVGAHTAMAISSVYIGKLLQTLEHCDEAARHYDPARRAAYHGIYRMDPGVFFRSEQARTLWVTGRPDAALRACDIALALANDSPDPRSKAFSLLFASVMHCLRREPEVALGYSSRCLAICEEHGIAQERAWAMNMQGWALGAMGKFDEGIRFSEATLAAQRAAKAGLNFTFTLRHLAELYLWKGEIERALSAADEGLMLGDRAHEFASAAELHRLKGEALAALGDASGAEAEFRRAIAVAREQQARSWQLRATVRLARLLVSAGRTEEAIEDLREIRSQFSEGADTEDLRHADAILADPSVVNDLFHVPSAPEAPRSASMPPPS